MIGSVLLTLSPLLSLVIGGIAVMLVDAFAPKATSAGVQRADLATISGTVLVATAGLAAGLWVRGTPADAPAWVTAYLATDRTALFFDVVIAAGAFFAVLLAGGYLREHDIERGEFYPLVLFSAFGAMVLARANDLLSAFIGLETMSLGAYTLVAFRRTSPRAVEGAMKYFLLGSFAAAILLFGSALLYGATGHTGLADIGRSIAAGEADVRLVVLAMMLLLVGLAFKVGAVPFHMWTPDAYEGAVTPVTVFMSVAVKAAAFAFLVRVVVVSFGDDLSASNASGWPPVLAGLAAVTMVYGNVAAAVQSSVKRMLAYSSIAHAGYLLVGLVAVPSQGESAIGGVLFYLGAYTVSNALAFGSLIVVGSRGREAVSYEDLAGVGRRHPMVAVPFVLGVLSLMGFPPTAGFFGKYLVFRSAVDAGGGMVWLAVLGILSSVVGAYYYLRVLVFMFMKEPKEGQALAVPMRSGYVVTALLLSGYFVLRMGIAPSAYLDWAVEAARKLLA
jgi:NADH-quinone oxidoreductase subunit N